MHTYGSYQERGRRQSEEYIACERRSVGVYVSRYGKGVVIRTEGRLKKKPNGGGPDERSRRRLYILIYIYTYIYKENARILPLHYTYQISFRTCTIANSRSLALARTARRHRLFEEGSRFNFSVTEPRLNYS